MGKRLFKKPEPTDIRGICVICSIRPQKKVGGKSKYRAICSTCDNEKYRSEDGKRKDKQRRNLHKRLYRKHLKCSCEICGFIPINSCQLDIDHIDGNHSNNEISNLQTLCANCHRLKTYINGDYINK